MKPPRAVLDTNVVISALLFPGPVSRLGDLWKSGTFLMLASGEMIGEYVRVLAYPRFELDVDGRRFLLHEEILPFVIPVKPKKAPPPTRRDPQDEKFLACARDGKADFLVTGDEDLLALRRIGRCRITPVAEFLRRLQSSTQPP